MHLTVGRGTGPWALGRVEAIARTILCFPLLERAIERLRVSRLRRRPVWLLLFGRKEAAGRGRACVEGWSTPRLYVMRLPAGVLGGSIVRCRRRRDPTLPRILCLSGHGKRLSVPIPI